LNALLTKFKEVLVAVLPVVILVIILSLTVAPIPLVPLIRFIIGALLIMIGLSLLLHGVDLAFLPLGESMGSTLLQSNKLWFVIIVSFILGFLITFAEPSVQALSEQVSDATYGVLASTLVRAIIALGAGALLSIGMSRIVKNFSIRVVLCIVLGTAFLLTLFAPDMLSIAFDAVGSATGAVTVPFILALALGAAAMKKDSISAEEDSFGLVGTTALGAVFGILILSLFVDSGGGEAIAHEAVSAAQASLIGPFFIEMPGVALDSFLTLLPIIVLFFIFQKFKFKMQKSALQRILFGFVYAFAGLFLFFVGVNAGFLEVGLMTGQGLAEFGSRPLIVGVGFILGMLIVLTEPAVHVFTHQIEDITNGHIKRKTVLVFLAIGVSFSVGLSMLRIVVPGIMLWHYLLPGFTIAAVLMFLTPKLFVGIGFDSGAVAAGPMTATFVLALTRGTAYHLEGADPLIDAFGVIAMVTMMPIIALQALGFIYKQKLKRKPDVDCDGA
jgi:hypothetical protein